MDSAVTIGRRFLPTTLVSLTLISLGTLLILRIGESLVLTQSPEIVDAIIVLGAPATPNGSPSKVMQVRVDKAFELYKGGYAPVVIFTGSAVGNDYVEAEVMSKYASELGLPASSMILETKATNTLENTLFSTQILNEQNWSSAIVVTSPYHTLRASKAFENYGMQIYTISAVDPNDLSLLTRVRDIIYEFFAFAHLEFTNLCAVDLMFLTPCCIVSLIPWSIPRTQQFPSWAHAM